MKAGSAGVAERYATAKAIAVIDETGGPKKGGEGSRDPEARGVRGKTQD